MKIINIEHEDFELVIEANNLDSVYNKAKKKHSQFNYSTSFNINEGQISCYSFETRSLEPLLNNSSNPLIFENKDYFIGIRIKNISNIEAPFIFSKVKDIEDKFFYRKELGFISGTLNFGNDLGQSNLIFRYIKDNRQKDIIFSFEVFPVKLDYRSDFNKILLDIENEYQNLVLDFLKKTFSSFKSGNSGSTDLIWWQVFGGIFKDFIKSSNFILSKPHKKITTNKKFVLADKINKWTANLEEEFKEYKVMQNKRYATNYNILSFNTSENKFFKHVVSDSFRRFKKIKQIIENKYSSSISENFKSELNQIEKELEVLNKNPFFKSIDSFKGIKQESLVLQKATGYSQIYKYWIMLNSGISFLDGSQKIELKNIAELYQIWCFLEIKNILQNILKNEPLDLSYKSSLTRSNFIHLIERGQKSKFTFTSSNNELVELYHEYIFDNSNKDITRSFTVKQKPDIVLRITKNDLIDNYTLTYIFDAKYRLASDDIEGSPDIPTDDSINQMHRYRDAIYYLNENKSNKPEKEVIGAYILFPGSGNVDDIKELEYYKSINNINIGAFPLRPNDLDESKQLLINHLKSLLGFGTNDVLCDVIPHKELEYSPLNPDVLIGYVPTVEHSYCFENNSEPFYYSGKIHPLKFGGTNLKYFAPYIVNKGICEFYEIIEYKLVKRNEIFKSNSKLYRKDNSLRLYLRLGKRKLIKDGNYIQISEKIGKIPYHYTTFKKIRDISTNNFNLLQI